ncbi:hypothetical protein B0T19DRAFT_75607 [Cercophora scortea]|uniref:Uncharacterized protein n=1 Tax=Cercophora scortea TaxID=314031 RepID=A0AAE0MMD9_9PEZI|nr:hypothetical protein B0T19DRAFT_75607 [Cercophora scortea]
MSFFFSFLFFFLFFFIFFPFQSNMASLYEKIHTRKVPTLPILDELPDSFLTNPLSDWSMVCCLCLTRTDKSCEEKKRRENRKEKEKKGQENNSPQRKKVDALSNLSMQASVVVFGLVYTCMQQRTRQATCM